MKEKAEKSPKKAGRIVFRIVLILLISVFFGSMIYTVNARRVMHDEMPMPLGIGVSVVLSGSMEDALQVNDLIVVKSADAYAVDDVVVYQSGSDLIVHRIISIDGDSVVTKGDANNTADDPISLSSIKGLVVFRIPFLGLLVQLLQTTLAKILIILLAAFLLHRSWVSQKTADDAELDAIKAEIRRLKEEEEARLQADSSQTKP